METPSSKRMSVAEVQALPNMEDILRDILSRRAELWNGKKGKIALSYGAREIIIFCNSAHNTFSTFIDTIPGEPKDHQTTSLYIAAYRLMVEIVTRKKEPYLYTFDTDVQKLQTWACKNGKDIFNWKYAPGSKGYLKRRAEVLPIE